MAKATDKQKKDNVIDEPSLCDTFMAAMNRVGTIDRNNTKYMDISLPYSFDLQARLVEPELNTHHGTALLNHIGWDYCLLPNKREYFLNLNDKDGEIIKKALLEDHARRYLLWALQDVSWLSEIVKLACFSRNGVINLNTPIASALSIHEALNANKPPAKVKSVSGRRALMFIIKRSLEKLGLIAHENDWATYHTDTADFTVADMTSAISESMVENIMLKLPNSSNLIGATRTNTFEVANDIMETHSRFIDEIIRFETFQKDISSFLARLKSWLVGSYVMEYGDESNIFISDDNFKQLSRNATLILMALDYQNGVTRTNAILWKMEDERIAQCIRTLTETSLFRQVSRTEFARMYNVDTINADMAEERRFVMVSKQIGSKESHHGYRSLSHVEHKRYIYDSRLDIFNSGIDACTSVNAKPVFLQMLASLSKLTDERVILYSGLNDWEKKLLAMAHASSIAIDKETGRIFYFVNEDRAKIGGRFLLDMFSKAGITTSEDIAIFLCVDDQSATENYYVYPDVCSLQKSTKYLGISSLMYDPFEKNIKVSINIHGNKQQKTYKCEIDFKRLMMKDSIGEYVCSINRKAVRDFFMNTAYLYTMRQIAHSTNDPTLEVYVDRAATKILLPVLKMAEKFEPFIYNHLWAQSKGDANMTTSIYSDLKTRSDIRIAAAKTMLLAAGLDITVVEPFIEDRRRYMLDLMDLQ